MKGKYNRQWKGWVKIDDMWSTCVETQVSFF